MPPRRLAFAPGRAILPAAMSGTILIIVHQEHSTPGRIGNMLRALGYTLDIRRPRFGDPLPETMAGHAGAIVFGGPMSANDPEPYLHRETDWLAVPLKEAAPLLGICLGAQLLARHLGGRVAFRDDGRVEVGYYPIHATPAGQAFGPWPKKVYQWHREGIEPPPGAELIATGDTFTCQAFRAGRAAFGLQFHPEVTLAMAHRWTTRAAERMTLPGAQPRAQHFAERFVHDAANIAWLARFLELWLAGDGRRKKGAGAASLLQIANAARSAS